MLTRLVFLAPLLLISAIAGPVHREDCSNVIVIFARGTVEPPPIGFLVGPQFRDAIAAALLGKSLTFTGVDYPADIPGFLEGGDPKGSKTHAKALEDAAEACPNAALITAGYSQGGQLVHNSAKLLTPATASRINAAVIFGDPDNGKPVAQIPPSKVLTICHDGDDICDGGVLVLPPHFTYAHDAPAAASFVANHVKELS